MRDDHSHDSQLVASNDGKPADQLPQKGTSQSIALMHEARALVPVQLEQRRLIHTEQSVRDQADVFREIRTRLLELADGRNFITLVVSVSPGCGSSFVARNLAAAFAFDEAKTSLLIDCNLRYPEQHRVLGVDSANGGLIDFLDNPSRGIQSVIYPTVLRHVRLIPAGTVRENVAEYFSSFQMRATIDSLRCRYADRYIFLDGPAVKGSPDARILAELADFVVLVAGYGKDTPAAVMQAASRFDPAKLAGVIFNQAP
jgi:Mrp family chromosome partitioning ATPase